MGVKSTTSPAIRMVDPLDNMRKFDYTEDIKKLSVP